MSKIFEHTLHKELWLWLADNPKKGECDWARVEILIERIIIALLVNMMIITIIER